MKSVIALFARAPERGKVKTRLARTHGDDFALALAQAMLADTLTLCGSIDVETRLFLTPDGFDGGTLWSGTTHPQGGDDLWARLLRADALLRAEGFEHVVLIGSDSPDLPQLLLRGTFHFLHTRDFMVGPSSDGGFYLLGSSRPLLEELFENVLISSRETCDALMNNLAHLRHEQEITYSKLSEWYDVDDEAGLNLFIERLRNGPGRAPRCREVISRYGLL